MNIFNPTMRLMQQVLDLRATQQRLIASNIANEETPGYQANELNFTDALAASRRSQALTVQVTHHRHLSVPGPAGQSFIHHVPTGDLPLDVNSVNIELEMAKLSDNAMHYKMTAELLARRFRGLINVIHEGQ